MATLRVERGVTLDAYLVVNEPVPGTEPQEYRPMDLFGLGALVTVTPGGCTDRVMLSVDSAEPGTSRWLAVEPPAEDVPEEFVDPDTGTRGLLWLHLGATVTDLLRQDGEMRVRLYVPGDPDEVTPAGKVTVVVEG